MAESNASLLHKNQPLHSRHVALDPRSLILAQFSGSDKPQSLRLTTEGFFVTERGPRYKEYSDLREKRLRKKLYSEQQTPEQERDQKLQNRPVLTPPSKQVKFNSNFITPPRRPKGSSVLTQSTPDFASSLRKENRKPASPLVAEKWKTPPAGPSKSGKVGGGSRSANSAEKRGGGLMGRKSMEELKGLGGGCGNAIRGDQRIGRGVLKTVLGYRQF